MLYKIISIYFLFIFGFVSAQQYHPVDAKVLAYPKSFSSIEKLVEKIQSDFTTDYDKARAVYVWIANNVSYDLKALRDSRVVSIEAKSTYELQKELDRLKAKRVNQVFKKKKECVSIILNYIKQ